MPALGGGPALGEAGLGGWAEAVELAAQELERGPRGGDDLLVRVFQQGDQDRHGVEVPGAAQAPRGDAPNPGIGIFHQLDEPLLVLLENLRPLGLVALDQPGEGLLGTLAPGVLQGGEHPLDRPVHRPDQHAASGDGQARQVLRQAPPTDERSRAEALDLDLLERLGGRFGQEEDAPGGVDHLAILGFPGAAGFLPGQEVLHPASEPVHAAERVAPGQGPDALQAVEAVIGGLADDRQVADDEVPREPGDPLADGGIDRGLGGLRGVRGAAGLGDQRIQQAALRLLGLLGFLVKLPLADEEAADPRGGHGDGGLPLDLIAVIVPRAVGKLRGDVPGRGAVPDARRDLHPGVLGFPESQQGILADRGIPGAAVIVIPGAVIVLPAQDVPGDCLDLGAVLGRVEIGEEHAGDGGLVNIGPPLALGRVQRAVEARQDLRQHRLDPRVVRQGLGLDQGQPREGRLAGFFLGNVRPQKLRGARDGRPFLPRTPGAPRREGGQGPERNEKSERKGGNA